MRKALCQWLAKFQREAPKANFKKPLSHAYYLAICKARSSTKWGCALRVVERRPFFYDSVVKDQIGSFLCHFPSAKHIFKASVACNGREVLRGTPGRRHGISAIEAADCLGNREPTIHWKVSRTSAACWEGPENTSRPALCGASPWGGFPETK